MSSPKPHQILKDFFEQKKSRNKQYSLRALARDLGVAPSFVSAVLSGKKDLPSAKIGKLAKILNLDDVALARLKTAVIHDTILKKSRELSLRKRTRRRTPAVDSFKEVSGKFVSLLENWYGIALLDLITCDGFKNDPLWIAGRLGISESQVHQTLKLLDDGGWIQSNAGKLMKSKEKIRFPTTRSYPAVRKFHKAMMERAILAMNKPDFDNRLITGVTCAGNPKHIARAREYLAACLYECAVLLMDGECTEVYQLNGQLFQLTR